MSKKAKRVGKGQSTQRHVHLKIFEFQERPIMDNILQSLTLFEKTAVKDEF